MTFLKAKDRDGTSILINLDNVTTIEPTEPDALDQQWMTKFVLTDGSCVYVVDSLELIEAYLLERQRLIIGVASV